LRVTIPKKQCIAGYDAILAPHDAGGVTVALWQVADLERHVDRHALLAAEDPAEPPYWAHLWSGARVLAEAVPGDAGRVLEVGCGLGLPGLVAAKRGASVVLVDREATPLAFVATSARANALPRASAVLADVLALPFRGGFDCVLAAELLYDRTLFGPLARALAAQLRPGGRLLLADGQRIDTRAFYPALAEAGLAWEATPVRVMEEGFAVEIRLLTAWCR
jgi:predicted nicotinamide N-methyase